MRLLTDSYFTATTSGLPYGPGDELHRSIFLMGNLDGAEVKGEQAPATNCLHCQLVHVLFFSVSFGEGFYFVISGNSPRQRRESNSPNLPNRRRRRYLLASRGKPDSRLLGRWPVWVAETFPTGSGAHCDPGGRKPGEKPAIWRMESASEPGSGGDNRRRTGRFKSVHSTVQRQGRKPKRVLIIV